MKRYSRAACVLAGLALFVLTTGPAGGQGSKPPTIKEIMGKLHKGANSPLTTVRADLQAEQPDWAEIQRAAKNFVTFGTALTRNDPPKGDKQSWAKLTGGYLENARSLEAAAQRKNKVEAIAAHTRLNDSCKGCHSVHRPN